MRRSTMRQPREGNHSNRDPLGASCSPRSAIDRSIGLRSGAFEQTYRTGSVLSEGHRGTCVGRKSDINLGTSLCAQTRST
jgi:hypothetical protein